MEVEKESLRMSRSSEMVVKERRFFSSIYGYLRECKGPG